MKHTNTQLITSAFISYKRDSSGWLAKALAEKLEKNYINTFLDINNIGVGKFEERLFIEIVKKDYFIIILNEEDILSISDKNDWVRRELDFAISNNKIVIPFYYGQRDRGSAELLANTHCSELSNYTHYFINIETFEESIDLIIKKMMDNESIRIKLVSKKNYLLFHSYIGICILNSSILWILFGNKIFS